ncbi:tRNA (mnm(5)s(2)U34)-methyltransferase [Bacillus benzoevorans]|uniref:Putative methyltransferase n=1 Tax=Bacillus benzoevorans TaxID=1456 RepID=A0A7X0HRW6_9BACI|nr:class I SAM-dependent methyltransferase [Bacillus benzoevorans]MBB6445774.1 putative methyltransferase [Bacillus benzoevorans]
MKLERILPFAKTLLAKAIKPGDAVVDGTLGNGHDAELLCELVGDSGQVFGFDIQETALRNSLKRIEKRDFTDRVTFYQRGHEHIKESIPPQYHGKITAAIFNLGYLPGGDKTLVTQPETTISAIEQLLSIMAPEGMIVLVIYHGHPEGAVERDILLQYAGSIDQKKAHVLQYRFINQINNPPFIMAIEKRAQVE